MPITKHLPGLQRKTAKRLQREQMKLVRPNAGIRKRTGRVFRQQWVIEEKSEKRNKKIFGYDKRRGTESRNFDEVDEEHGFRIIDLAIEAGKNNPGKYFDFLDEGTGLSAFPIGFKNKFEAETGRKARMHMTDINPKINQGVKKGVTLLSPEFLVEKFGKNRFDFIVSTQGGVTFTKGSRLKAVANIVSALKPGGIASILTRSNEFFTLGRAVKKSELKQLVRAFPGVEIEERIIPKGRTPKIQLIIRKMKKAHP